MSSAPLSGIRVLELAGLAPGPYAGLVLADYGADIVRLDPAASKANGDSLTRGKRSIAVSLKTAAGLALVKKLLSPEDPSKPGDWRADVLIDPFRPGVLERLGLDPKELINANPRLIVARMTGFRREGPYAKMAGHDINYLALSGVLHTLGRKGQKPTPPINLLADFAGGGLMCALGVILAVVERNNSGKGQVVEADMLTQVRYLSTFVLTAMDTVFTSPRGENLLDTGCPFYDVYEAKGGGHMSLGALEPQFYKIALETLLAKSPSSIIPSPRPTPADQYDKDGWPALKVFFEAAFLTKTREEWAHIFLGTDACCVPVLKPSEVGSKGEGPLEDGRGWDGPEGIPEPRPTLSRTPAHKLASQEKGGLIPGSHTAEVLKAAGLAQEEVGKLIKEGVVVVGRASKL